MTVCEVAYIPELPGAPRITPFPGVPWFFPGVPPAHWFAPGAAPGGAPRPPAAAPRSPEGGAVAPSLLER